MISISRREFLSAMAMAGMGQGATTGWPAFAEEPLLSGADQAFLGDQARAILDSARLMPGQEKGKYRNLTPDEVHVPGGNMGYPAFWVRDAVMMLETDFIELAELEGWIRLMSSVLRDQDWNVRPGVVVPAFAVPDHINLDGKPTFYPGNYETGAKQGGNPFGKYPPLDDHFYYIFAAWYQWKKSGSTAFFRSKMKTTFGEMQLAELCQRVYRVAPGDPATALCTAGNVDTENAKDFGFCDSVSKSGKLLFTSVLKYVAALRLAELLTAAGLADKTAALRSDARKIKAAIPATFLHPSPDGKEAWLDSATGVGHQPDVWGSAYAVYSGAVDPAAAVKIGRALVRAYHEKTAVREGCVSNVLSNDAANPKGWQKTVSAPGVYQNGGYWGTPVGWYLVAMHKHDQAAAAAMARDYIGFLRTHHRPDGLAESWEWFNPDTGRNANPLYVATIDLPYGCLCESGLIGRKK